MVGQCMPKKPLCLTASPQVTQLVGWIQWRDKVLKGIHIIWPSHLLHQKLHLDLKLHHKIQKLEDNP